MASDLQKAWDIGHIDFAIYDIEWEDDARLKPDEIRIEEYPAPSITVDSSGRFVTHEIIGGSTVRQKVGEDPIEIDISGVCEEGTAKRLDVLRDAKSGNILTGRLPGNTMTVQFASVSTSPLSEGGAVALSESDSSNRGAGSRAGFLHTYDISCVEVN